MQQPFEEYKTKFQARIKSIESKLNQNNKQAYGFYNEKPLVKRLNAANKFLDHLQNYEQTTLELSAKYPENTAFYNAHLKQAISLLTTLEEKYKNPENLKFEDFKLIVPRTVQYTKTHSDNFQDILSFCAGGVVLATMLFGIFGCAAGTILGVMAATPSAGMGAPYAIMAFAFFGALACAIAGALVGAVLGLLVGIIVVPCLKTPINNKYLAGTAFDTKLLHAAYVELSKAESGCADIKQTQRSVGVSANDGATQSLGDDSEIELAKLG